MNEIIRWGLAFIAGVIAVPGVLLILDPLSGAIDMLMKAPLFVGVILLAAAITIVISLMKNELKETNGE